MWPSLPILDSRSLKLFPLGRLEISRSPSRCRFKKTNSYWMEALGCCIMSERACASLCLRYLCGVQTWPSRKSRTRSYYFHSRSRNSSRRMSEESPFCFSSTRRWNNSLSYTIQTMERPSWNRTSTLKLPSERPEQKKTGRWSREMR